jgi:hypothetical protein
MSTELKETAEVIEELATSARKQVRGFERKSTRAARRINRRFNAQVRSLAPEKVNVWGLELNSKLPEKAAVKGLHLVRLQARREDRMGVVAKRALHMLNTSFKTIVRVATRFEQASELTPHHAAAVKPAARPRARRHTVRRAA